MEIMTITDWTIFWNVIWVVIFLVAGFALVTILRDSLISKRRKDMIDQIADQIMLRYLPTVKQITVETSVEIVDKMVDKIPKLMEKTMKSFENLEDGPSEEED